MRICHAGELSAAQQTMKIIKPWITAEKNLKVVRNWKNSG